MSSQGSPILPRADRIFLFDIDGTLMRRIGPHHGEALVEAIHHVLEVSTSMEAIPVHGMLDGDILATMLTRAGVASGKIDEALPLIMERAQLTYPAFCPDLRAKVLPGIRETLAEIHMRGFPAGLVTGNLARIGWTKVERAGLREYFSFGAFADMGRTRGELARLASGLAGAVSGALVTLIGDSPSDVIAARENGFRCVAVASGMTPLENLAALGPALVLPDLSRPENRELLIYG